MNNKTTNPRRAALDSLIAAERDGRYSNLEINASIGRSDMTPADRGLYTRLVYGVIERRLTLDHVIGKFSKIPPAQLDDDVLNALRLGLYQLLWMDRVPDHAAVSETAALVQKSKVGYVNAVLRTFLRAGKQIAYPPVTDFYRYCEVKYSVPAETVRFFEESCGVAREETEEFLAAMNREPHIALRVNRLRLTAEEAAAKCGGAVSESAPDIVLTDALDDTVKAGLADGGWFVQDEASRIVSAALGAQPGETVVDSCACPGGKSFSIAIDMHNEGAVYSYDLHKNKLSLIEKGAEKLGITVIRTEARDARKPDEALAGKADRVLCDAPCSGLGVIAKKPDIRYKNLDDIARLPEIQYGILCGASTYVRPGGVLVYSTCTVNRAENEDVVNKFLAEHEDFTLDDDTYLPGGMRTFMPHRDGCDGFFGAKMIRKSSEFCKHIR